MSIKVYTDTRLGGVIAVDTGNERATVLHTQEEPSPNDWTPELVAGYVWFTITTSPASNWLAQVEDQVPLFEVES